MKMVSITDAKNRLSALIDGLKNGSPVVIVDRGRPVARLEAIRGSADQEGGRLSRLVRDGVIRPGRRELPRSLLKEEPPHLRRDASAVTALIEERREGR